MKKYRIIQIGEKQPKYKIQERGLFWIWTDMYFNIVHKEKIAPNVYSAKIDTDKYIFNSISDAKHVLNIYKPILYKGEIIYPCINEIAFEEIQILYFRQCERIPGCLDVLKNDIDRDIRWKGEREKIRQENEKDRKYRKVVYMK